MFCVVWDHSSSKLKDKWYKQKTSLQSYKTEIKILANPGLAELGFEQFSPRLHVSEMHTPYDKHHKVSSFIKSHQNTYICQIWSNVKITLCDASRKEHSAVLNTCCNRSGAIELGLDIIWFLWIGGKGLKFQGWGKFVSSSRVTAMLISCIATKEELKWPQGPSLVRSSIPWENYQFCQHPGLPVILPPSSTPRNPLPPHPPISAFLDFYCLFSPRESLREERRALSDAIREADRA